MFRLPSRSLNCIKLVREVVVTFSCSDSTQGVVKGPQDRPNSGTTGRAIGRIIMWNISEGCKRTERNKNRGRQ